MNDLSKERIFGDEEEAQGAQGDRERSARRRSSTSIWGSTPKRKFDELISTIHNMTRVMTSME